MSTAARPLTNADRQLLVAWAKQWQRELAPTHPAQELLAAGVRHYSAPPFPVSMLDLAPEPLRDRSGAALAWAAVGSVLFAAAGAVLPVLPMAITCAILGALALTIAFDRAE